MVGAKLVVELGEPVLGLQFSPYEWSHEVIAIAFPSRILIASLKFREEFEDEQTDEIEFERIQELSVGAEVGCLSWSPLTSIRDVPRSIVLACATADHAIAVYISNVVDAYTHKVLSGHWNYVNSVSYDPSGAYMASTGDDLTVRVWNVTNDYAHHCLFYLCSPGVEVKWHGSDAGKLAVGEKCGTVRLYSVGARGQQRALVSLLSTCLPPGDPLTSIDWAPSNPSLVAALRSTSLLLWSTASPSNCNVVRGIHSEVGRCVRFSRLSEHKIVTLGQPDNTLKLFQTNKQYPKTIANLKLANGLTWHHHLPYVCVGVDKNICLWKIT